MWTTHLFFFLTVVQRPGLLPEHVCLLPGWLTDWLLFCLPPKALGGSAYGGFWGHARADRRLWLLGKLTIQQTAGEWKQIGTENARSVSVLVGKFSCSWRQWNQSTAGWGWIWIFFLFSWRCWTPTLYFNGRAHLCLFVACRLFPFQLPIPSHSCQIPVLRQVASNRPTLQQYPSASSLFCFFYFFQRQRCPRLWAPSDDFILTFSPPWRKETLSPSRPRHYSQHAGHIQTQAASMTVHGQILPLRPQFWEDGDTKRCHMNLHLEWLLYFCNAAFSFEENWSCD